MRAIHPAGRRRGRRARRASIALILVALATSLAASTATGQRAAAGQQAAYKAVGKWGKTGTGNGMFASTTKGIAVDRAGHVYVADTDNNRIQVFSASGGFLRKWGSNGGGNGQFAVAEDVNIASDGTVWVADQQNSRLQAFSPTGAFKLSIGFTSELPRGVGVDADGNVLAAVEGSSKGGFRRFDPAGTPIGALLGGGSYRVDDVEVSPDGTVYLTTAATQSSDDRIRRFTADGRPLGTIKLANGDGTRGIGVDLDCNVWASDTAGRQIVKYSPSGKRLATASVPDLVANDVAVGPKGDLYVIHQNTGIVRFAEDRSKPGTAIATVSLAKKGARAVARVKYTLAGVACPAQVDATASLSGAGVSGSAKVKVGAGKTTVIEIPLAKSPKRGASATFKIVLRTNGRPTTQTAAVRLG